MWYVLAAACLFFYVYRVRALSFHVATTFVESSSVYNLVLIQNSNTAMTTSYSTTQCRTPHPGAADDDEQVQRLDSFSDPMNS